MSHRHGLPGRTGSARLRVAVVLVLFPAVAAFALERPAEVAYVPATEVAAAFLKGMPLVERDGYKVHASRRDGAGKAEVHTRDVDILYVLEGTSTVVIGGEVVDPQSVGPEEIRGASIRGGASRHLSKGDLLIIPNGVPHWFRDVPGPFLYYVVKVRDEEAGR